MKRTLPLLAAALMAMGGVATAGTPADPEITDPAGDANASGRELDTRPASIDSADLRAVWFETTFDTNKVLDAQTGEVLRVEHVPTGLLVHIRTEAPVHPTWQDRTMFYRVRANSTPNCSVRFELQVPPGGSGGSASVYREINTCPGIGNPTTAGLVAFEGDVAKLVFPYTTGPIQELLPVGTTLSSFSEIRSFTMVSALPVVIDRAAEGGRSFTIGQDVPPDIDCTEEPDHPECQP